MSSCTVCCEPLLCTTVVAWRDAVMEALLRGGACVVRGCSGVVDRLASRHGSAFERADEGVQQLWYVDSAMLITQRLGSVKHVAELSCHSVLLAPPQGGQPVSCACFVHKQGQVRTRDAWLQR